MGGPRLVPDVRRPRTQTFGDILHELAQIDAKTVQGLERLARWKLSMLKIEPPPLRAKHYLRRPR